MYPTGQQERANACSDAAHSVGSEPLLLGDRAGRAWHPDTATGHRSDGAPPTTADPPQAIDYGARVGVGPIRQLAIPSRS
jgi:hypothetical protein